MIMIFKRRFTVLSNVFHTSERHFQNHISVYFTKPRRSTSRKLPVVNYNKALVMKIQNILTIISSRLNQI